jgi:hypothetical protein
MATNRFLLRAAVLVSCKRLGFGTTVLCEVVSMMDGISRVCDEESWMNWFRTVLHGSLETSISAARVN